jgi:antitoxin (DNA-binding transcriptional repressor) of toxin-antitoxin stability system
MAIIAEKEFLEQPARYLEVVHGGESLILSTDGEPSAMVFPLNPTRRNLRPFGLFKGEITVPADFNDPLPEDLMDLFTTPLS